MRTAICAVTSLVAMACLPGVAAASGEQQHSSETAFAADIGSSIEAAALDSYRAGANVHNSILTEGTVEKNTAINVVTGMNSITEGSFANASGLPIVIQNSGANVLIQNATVINVEVQ